MPNRAEEIHFKIANATQNDKNNICVNCRQKVALTPESYRYLTQRRRNYVKGDKIDIKQSVDIYIHHNIYCWPNRHAICNECAKIHPSRLDIQTNIISEYNIAKTCWPLIFAIVETFNKTSKI